jgi:hypothetical protein
VCIYFYIKKGEFMLCDTCKQYFKREQDQADNVSQHIRMCLILSSLPVREVVKCSHYQDKEKKSDKEMLASRLFELIEDIQNSLNKKYDDNTLSESDF